MTLTYISCSSDFYTFYVNIPLSLGCIIRKVSAEDIAIRGNGTGQEYMCPIRHFVCIFFNPVFQVSTAKNEINLFNNHFLIVAPVTFAPAGAMTPSAEFLFFYTPQNNLRATSFIFPLIITNMQPSDFKIISWANLEVSPISISSTYSQHVQLQKCQWHQQCQTKGF